MALWVVWLGVAAALGIAEALTLTAALGIVSGAALLTAGAAAIGVPVAAQLIVFALTSAAGVVLLRPARFPRPERFGAAGLPGRTGHVVREVTGRAGLVRIGGDEWTARALDGGTAIPAGAFVQVLRVDGATVVVHAEE
jgi:membrane protein implicated in regulation of membrane protease activity